MIRGLYPTVKISSLVQPCELSSLLFPFHSLIFCRKHSSSNFNWSPWHCNCTLGYPFICISQSKTLFLFSLLLVLLFSGWVCLKCRTFRPLSTIFWTSLRNGNILLLWQFEFNEWCIGSHILRFMSCFCDFLCVCVFDLLFICDFLFIYFAEWC